MSNYTNLIYPNTKNDYPAKLCKYIYSRFSIRNQTLLDIGCNKGTHFKEFSKLGAKCYGLDLRRDFDHKRVYNCNLEKDKFPFNDNMFDFIWCKSVFEHITNIDNVLSEMYRVLKPKGTFIVMTPDWESQITHFWDDYTHVKAWTIKGLANAFRIYNFSAYCEKFYQLPFVWNNSWLEFIPKMISICPQSWKWKDKSMSNCKDRKLIRFSKELMLLAYGVKNAD